ncbi:MAG: acyltransferase [Lachnospiraceae bacterium]|nr:acyltransferase [Lachnospiraceae bacterium]
MKTKKNGAIELLRILGASFIVLYHHQQGTKIDFLPIAFCGGKFNFARFVELFFLISGYLLYKHVDDIREDSSLIEFGEKRIIRFFPMLSITVIAEFILRKISSIVVGGVTYSFGVFDLLVNALGLQQLGIFETRAVNQPTWFLSVLIFCIILFFASTKAAKKRNVNPYSFYVIFVILASAIITYKWNTLFLNIFIARGLFSFFFGIILGKYLYNVKASKYELGLAVFPISFVLLTWLKPGWLQTGNDFLYTLMMWIPILIFAVRWNPKFLSENRTISMLGAASFSVYLWNEPLACLRGILVKTDGLRIDTVGFMIIFFIVNWLVGIASYLYLETPINKFIRNRLSQKCNQQQDEIQN